MHPAFPHWPGLITAGGHPSTSADLPGIARFGDPAAEAALVRNTVGVCDLSACGKIRLTGPDAAGFLHGMCSNDVKALRPGGGCGAAFLTPKGKMVADASICLDDAGFLLLTMPAAASPLLEHLRRYLVAERLEISDVTAGHALFSIQGGNLLGPVVDAAIRGAPESLADGEHAEVTVAGVKAQLIAIERTGLPSADLLVNAPEAGRVWNEFATAVRGLGGGPFGWEALDILRIEGGVPWWGRELTAETLPPEAGLDRVISYTKGCYVGQEIIARIRTYGHVNRTLRGLVGEGPPPAAGAPIELENKTVGRVTSACASPAMKSSIALAYLPREIEAGAAVRLLSSTGTTAARISELPFVR